MLTDDQIGEFSEHNEYLKKNPNEIFGQQGSDDSFFNTRDGEPQGQEIDMHDDEPVIMGQASISSSSDSSDSEDDDDKDAHIGAL